MLHLDAATLLDWPRVAVTPASRDVALVVPFRSGELLRLTHGAFSSLPTPAVPEPKAPPPVAMTRLEYWQAVWDGAARDPRAEEIILWTAAAALMMLEPQLPSLAGAREIAGELWRTRG